MIAFSCAHCAMKFQVKDEFAGRSTRCPTCKHPLAVPPAPVAAAALPSHFDGPLSTLARAGIPCDVTLAGPPPASNGKAARPVAAVLAGQPANGQRYLLEGEIARGGMGAVLRAVDCDIRREVAVKYLLDQSDPRKKVRFVEEAQVTGQLEHPNIVPIHEVGVDGQGRLFFAMKMVHGRSLQQILEELRESPRAAAKEWPLGRLLTVFVSVCNALAYAHSRGVVHRDLKPANIMVGDFGEAYVMDWGLAKILRRPATAESTAVIQATPSFAWAEGADSSTAKSATVRTSRQESDDRTMDGAILGTPLYMAPEQALGQLDAIDPRTDVYALGAILYEMLTLLPPIDRDGGPALILARVIHGELVPPEKLAPGRRIPPELSAIALKALAKEPADRYPSVEALRRDVELYQEGRSVSAREDTKWELARKFVKRNKAFSATAAAAVLLLAVVLVWSSVVNYQARRATDRAFQDYQREQSEKEKRTRQAVPAFVEAARLAVERQRFDNALEQVNLALDYDPGHAGARLLRGQLLIVKNDFAGARTALADYLRRRPGDREARRLIELCGRPKAGDIANLLALAQQFEIQKVSALADGLLRRHGGRSFEVRKKLLELYRKRIEAAWPGLGSRLSLDDAGIYHLDVSNCKQVSLLDPLEGMPLTYLSLYSCGQVRDLSPLKGMPLTSLSLWECGQVRDLSPLKGMPLTTLYLNSCSLVSDLSPLKGMPLTSLDLRGCALVRDLSPLKGMPLTTLNLNSCSLVSDLSPLKGMPLTSLTLDSCSLVRDLSPLKGMPLTTIVLPPQVDRGMNVLRQIKTLVQITVNYRLVAEFWKKYDAGAFRLLKP